MDSIDIRYVVSTFAVCRPPNYSYDDDPDNEPPLLEASRDVDRDCWRNRYI